VKAECLPQLLPRPFRRWVGSHIEVQHSTAITGGINAAQFHRATTAAKQTRRLR